MQDEEMLTIRRALFLDGLSQGLDAEELHAYIIQGLQIAWLARLFEDRPKETVVRAAG
jgi:hypothetical protein